MLSRATVIREDPHPLSHHHHHQEQAVAVNYPPSSVHLSVHRCVSTGTSTSTYGSLLYPRLVAPSLYRAALTVRVKQLRIPHTQSVSLRSPGVRSPSTSPPEICSSAETGTRILSRCQRESLLATPRSIEMRIKI